MTVFKTNLKDFPCKRGKVRDVYDIGNNQLVIVACDRISAFDWVLKSAIPEKGKILTKITCFWLKHFCDLFPNHFITSDLSKMPEPFQKQPEIFDGRTMLVEKCQPFQVEFIIRGYICGSGWGDYKKTGEICGHKLPSNLQENMAFPFPIFTPSTKAENGHDVNISIDEVRKLIPEDLANIAIEQAKRIFTNAQVLAWHRGIIIADTKFEFGISKNGLVTLIDEVLTPDSSRYWPIENYSIGKSLPSLDKQYVRDYLSSTGWDKNSEPPELPQEIIEKTREKYLQIAALLTGE